MTCCGLLSAHNKIKEKWMSTRHGINWDKALQLHAAERERFIAARPQSQQLSARADQHLLFGVPLHWMDDWSTPSPCM
jgi:glutamate-1-semialdehyde 2,1-aminomutase